MKNFMLLLFLVSIVLLIFLLISPDRDLTNTDLKRIENKKFELIEKTQQLYGVYFDLPIFIEPINKRIWGAMVYKGLVPKKIVINRGYYLENPDYVINYVLPHEWAHVVTRLLYKKSIMSHGKEWKQICQALSEFRCDVRVQDEFVAQEKIRSSLRELFGE